MQNIPRPNPKPLNFRKGPVIWCDNLEMSTLRTLSTSSPCEAKQQPQLGIPLGMAGNTVQVTFKLLL